jgi:NitT/TauT family transport system substrate-binding protein
MRPAAAILIVGALWSTALACRADALDRVTLLYQPVVGFNNAYVAADQGFFAKHGLEVVFQMSPLASNVISIIESGQVQIGGPTMLPVLQADENGLDIAVLAGGAVYPLPGDGLVAATGSGIDHARDLKGKIVGVPGFGTQLHVLAVRGLEESGVDPALVKFVELGFPQAGDALKSRLVDAYTSVEPFTQRITKTGVGKLIPDWPEVPDGTTTIVYAATRQWADAHQRDIEQFRAALSEADAFIKTHRDETIRANSHYTKLPVEAISAMPISNNTATLSQQQVQFWIDLARQQNLIQGNPDPKSILYQ